MVPSDPNAVRTKALAARSPADGLNAPTFRAVAKSHGQPFVAAVAIEAVHAGISLLAASRRLSPDHVSALVDEILSAYPTESLEDIAAFARGVGLGRYKGSEIYSIVDIPRMMAWWREYLGDKSAAMEIQADRSEVLNEQGAREAIAAIPELGKAVGEFVIDAKERSELVRKQSRLRHLREHCPTMTDDALRAAWKVYPAAEERSVIQAEAARRGLLGEEHMAAQLEIDKLSTDEKDG